MPDKPGIKKALGVILAALVVPACLLLFKGSAYCAAKEKPDIILITAGALRPDHLSCYGYEHTSTPAIDSLAENGFLYTSAYCNTPDNRYGWSSILTGRFGYEAVSLKGDYFYLNDLLKTLPEFLRESDYATAAVTSSPFLASSQPLFKKGFDLFENTFTGKKVDNSIMLATDRGIEAARQLKSRNKPVFIWLEYCIPGYPYKVPEEFRMAENDFAYDRQVLFLDSEIKRLIAGLKEAGLRKDAVIIFTATSGEGLDEHNEPVHGVFLYQSTVKIPLIIKAPSGKGTKKAGQLAILADIAPTALSRAGIKYPKENFSGKDLAELSSGKKAQDRALYLETVTAYAEYGWSPMAALIQDGYKYIESPKPALYNIKEDPYELRNLRLVEGQRSMQMQSQLFKHLEESRREVLDIINKGEDPAQKTWILKLYITGGLGFAQADPAARLKLYKKLLFKDPANKKFVFQLAELYLYLKKPHLSEYYLSGLLKKYPDSARGWELLGEACSAQGKDDEAIEAYKKALAIAPDALMPLNNLAWAYAKKKTNLEEALACAKKASELAPDLPPILDTLAEVYSAKGEKEKAAETLKRAVALDSQSEYLKSRLKEIQSGP